MNIGFCTTDFKKMPAKNLFKKLSELGTEVTQFSFSSISEIEFNPDGVFEIPKNISGEIADIVKKEAKLSNIKVSAVNGTFNMAHPDPWVRENGIKRFEGFAEAVHILGAEIITLCTGTRNTENLWQGHPDNQSEEAFNDLLATAKALVKIADKYNIILAPETEVSNIIDTPEKARRLLDEVGSKSLKMVIDPANLFHIGKAHSENVKEILEHAFSLFGADIVIAHGKDISDSDGVNFCPTGEGIIDYPYLLALLSQYSFKGDMMIHSVFDENKMPLAIETIKNAQVLTK